MGCVRDRAVRRQGRRRPILDVADGGACCTKLCFELFVFQARDLPATSSPVLIMALLSFLPQKGKSLVPSCLRGVDKLVSSWSDEHSQPTCCSGETGWHGQHLSWLPASSSCPNPFLLQQLLLLANLLASTKQPHIQAPCNPGWEMWPSSAFLSLQL